MASHEAGARSVRYPGIAGAQQAGAALPRRVPPPWLVVLGMLVLAGSGCSESGGELPLVGRDVAAAGTKMLRPDARAEACRLRLFGRELGAAPAPLDRAVQELLASDSEADALANVRIRTRSVGLGIGDRTCVTVEADVVRMVSVIRLPAPAGHEGHH